jgi:hypothetical protein
VILQFVQKVSPPPPLIPLSSFCLRSLLNSSWYKLEYNLTLIYLFFRIELDFVSPFVVNWISPPPPLIALSSFCLCSLLNRTWRNIWKLNKVVTLLELSHPTHDFLIICNFLLILGEILTVYSVILYIYISMSSSDRSWMYGCDRITSGRASSLGSTWAILDEARTQSTHISTIPYFEVQVEVITT